MHWNVFEAHTCALILGAHSACCCLPTSIQISLLPFPLGTNLHKLSAILALFTRNFEHPSITCVIRKATLSRCRDGQDGYELNLIACPYITHPPNTPSLLFSTSLNYSPHSSSWYLCRTRTTTVTPICSYTRRWSQGSGAYSTLHCLPNQSAKAFIAFLLWPRMLPKPISNVSRPCPLVKVRLWVIVKSTNGLR